MYKGITLLVVVIAGLSQAEVTIETVPVGNAGNTGEWAGSTHGGSGPDRWCGRVEYTYNIGEFEITAGQYVDFLNAAAKVGDPYGLYDSRMDWQRYPEYEGCSIQQYAVESRDDFFIYAVDDNRRDRPVNFISWGDAARFCNWMHNGQPQYALQSTEDGSYTLKGAMTDEELTAVTRNPDATWVIPTEDEWYKAAYHKNDGVTGNYYDYPTSSDSNPSMILSDPDQGNTATYGNVTIGSPYYRTEVGEHENSASPYGTFDQGGNVYEWTEAIVDDDDGPYRLRRGGSYGHLSGYGWGLHAAARFNGATPSTEISHVGFRLALVPEPSALTIFGICGLVLLRRSGGNCHGHRQDLGNEDHCEGHHPSSYFGGQERQPVTIDLLWSYASGKA